MIATRRTLPNVIGSIALGAIGMYLLDPAKGRRRRAIVRDKLQSVACDGRDLFATAARDMRFRAQGLKARARQLAHRHEVPADDLVLIERVRARLGRVCSHPHAIQVGANHGRVAVSGPVLASEAERVLDTVRKTWGAIAVEDRLVAYERTESISSLQGGVERPAHRAAWLRDNWTPSLRVAALVGGSLLAVSGARRGGIAGVILAAVGVSLATRGAINVPLQRLAARRARGSRSSLPPCAKRSGRRPRSASR